MPNETVTKWFSQTHRSPFAVPSKPGGLQRSGVLVLKKILHLYIYKIIIEFGSRISPGRAVTSLPSHGAHSGAAAPRAEGRDHPTRARWKGRGPEGTRPRGHCVYPQDRALGCGGTRMGCLGDSTTLFPTLCRCFLRGCKNWFGKTVPVVLDSAGRQRFSPSCRGLPFAFFTFTRRRSFFPYFIQRFHVNGKSRFYRSSLI